MTKEEFENRLKEKRGDIYEILSPYQNLYTKIDVRCKKCGYIFSKRPDVLLRGHKGCCVCSNGVIKTAEDFGYYIKYNIGEDFELVSEYNGKESPVTILHKTCGREFTVLAKTFIKYKKCYACHPPQVSGNQGVYAKTESQYMEEVRNKFGDEWILIDEYKGTTKKIRHQHKCGFIINCSPCIFLKNKHNCLKCGNYKSGKLMSNEEYVNKLLKEFNGEYKAVDEYINSNTKIRVEHSCGCVFKVSPHKLFTRHTLCPMCNSSKGESKILSFLQENNISFQKEYCFSGCKSQRVLPFDFAIFDKNNNLSMLIEYDGEQHFRPIGYFGGEKGYEETIKRDNIKTNFCKENNIPLLRIKYTDFENLDKILSGNLL